MRLPTYFQNKTLTINSDVKHKLYRVVFLLEVTNDYKEWEKEEEWDEEEEELHLEEEEESCPQSVILPVCGQRRAAAAMLTKKPGSSVLPTGEHNLYGRPEGA